MTANLYSNQIRFTAISIQVQKVIQALEDSDDPMVAPTHSMKMEPNMSVSPDTIEVIVSNSFLFFIMYIMTKVLTN